MQYRTSTERQQACQRQYERDGHPRVTAHLPPIAVGRPVCLFISATDTARNPGPTSDSCLPLLFASLMWVAAAWCATAACARSACASPTSRRPSARSPAEKAAEALAARTVAKLWRG